MIKKKIQANTCKYHRCLHLSTCYIPQLEKETSTEEPPRIDCSVAMSVKRFINC